MIDILDETGLLSEAQEETIRRAAETALETAGGAGGVSVADNCAAFAIWR